MPPSDMRALRTLCRARPPATSPRSRRPWRQTASNAAFSHRSFPAWFVRGGTSNGLVIRRQDLPPEDEWPSVLPSAMGSPDPDFGRQLNGMGSGQSSTSKVVVLGAPSRAGADVDYTFVQVGIRDGALDKAGNCGNMSAIVGPAAWGPGPRRARHRVGARRDGPPRPPLGHVSGSPARYAPEGEYVMDGVPGAGSVVTLSFVDPAGAKTGRALPTGAPVDTLRLPGGSRVRASLVDVGNPGVFVSTHGLGLDRAAASALTPAAIEADAALKARLEQIRRAGAARMSLDPDVESVPKIVLLFPGGDTPDGVDIRCVAMSMGQAHKAVPLTLALCLGASARIPGTLAADLVAARPGGMRDDAVTIAHPSGKLDVGTEVEDGKILSAKLLRTARVLMKGDVYY
ncbi:PrpF family protein [Metarhizium robertsii]|uniref:PrpF family protein n=1 Tax=Metarhizium robertsii TaxID=568076 RepID=A0A0A1V014_9HYPO|nr:PrpF family protein [Metarhizium robertsii]